MTPPKAQPPIIAQACRTAEMIRRELYASVSLFVCVLFIGLGAWGIDSDPNMFVCFALGLGFRMLALRSSWKLPTFSYQQRWD